MAVVDQGLDLHQHWPGTFPGGHDHTARHFLLGSGEKNRRRIGDLLQSPVGHAEYSQLVHCAETIFYRPQQTQATVGLTFEVQHGIDHMFEYARPRQGALLGHVPDQEDRRAALLGVTHQQGRTFAHLGHSARCRLQLLGENRLDRVDHHDFRFFHPSGSDDGFDTGFGHHP